MALPVVSSWITYKWKYDVFLSFHGEDTRLGFVGFLRESLRQRGIHVFYDDDSIRIGEEITPALFNAIQESRIAIIVFSENYASSTFCLQELEKILECFKEDGRLVYPVFYYVDPSELRRPTRSYAKALARLEERFKDDKQKVEKWRLALYKAVNLKGSHLKSKSAKEQEYTTKIINEVSARITCTHNPLHITRYPVGLVSRVKQVISLLDVWSDKENKMVGIVGAGGIGKSTIARAVYNAIVDHFEGVCFLFNVRKESKINGLTHLQETLISKLLMEKDIRLGDFHEGIPIIQRRLGCKKILLVLDDVDALDQLEALAGSCNWFGLGSRIVITTRNKQLLENHDVSNIYNVKELNDEESLQLLGRYAFRTENNVEFNFTEVFKRAILYCCGFPLALEVIGSNLRGKGVNEIANNEEKIMDILGPMNVPQLMPRNVSQSMPINVPQSMPRNVSQSMPMNAPQSTPIKKGMQSQQASLKGDKKEIKSSSGAIMKNISNGLVGSKKGKGPGSEVEDKKGLVKENMDHLLLMKNKIGLDKNMASEEKEECSTGMLGLSGMATSTKTKDSSYSKNELPRRVGDRRSSVVISGDDDPVDRGDTSREGVKYQVHSNPLSNSNDSVMEVSGVCANDG